MDGRIIPQADIVYATSFAKAGWDSGSICCERASGWAYGRMGLCIKMVDPPGKGLAGLSGVVSA